MPKGILQQVVWRLPTTSAERNAEALLLNEAAVVVALFTNIFSYPLIIFGNCHV
jgi:hypothetical protein